MQAVFGSQEETMKDTRSSPGRDGPFGGNSIENALLIAGLAVATVVVVSAGGGSLDSVLAAVWDALSGA
jgi:hypothetical protein